MCRARLDQNCKAEDGYEHEHVNVDEHADAQLRDVEFHSFA